MATEVVDTSSLLPSDEQEAPAVTTTTNILPDTTASPSSINTLVKELLSVLETQEATLLSIESSDVNESALEPLARAKVGNKEALVKLAEVMEAMKHMQMDSAAPQQQENFGSSLSLNQSISTLPLSPIMRADSAKTSPPGSPSKYFHTLSFSKHKRFSLGGGSKSADSSLDESREDKSNSLSTSMGGAETARVRPKKNRRSITQFLTMKPSRAAAMSMSHSTSTPTLATTIRADIIPSYALDSHHTSESRRVGSLPTSPTSPGKSKDKEKIQAEDMYTLQIQETSRMLFEKKRNLMQQHNATDISA